MNFEDLFSEEFSNALTSKMEEADKIFKRRTEVIEDFLDYHMSKILPPELHANKKSKKHRKLIAKFLDDHGYHQHIEGNWLHLVQGQCVVGKKPKCERIASLYIEVKL